MNKNLKELAKQVERQERWVRRLPLVSIAAGVVCVTGGVVFSQSALIVAGGAIIFVGIGLLFVVPRGPVILAAPVLNKKTSGVSELMRQKEWLKLAYAVKSAYSAKDESAANKEKLIEVVSAFKAAFDARSTKNENDFYLGKLIRTGRVEGTHDEVMGTVPGQVQKSIEFINSQPLVYCNQAAIFSEALINCIDKELFKIPLDEVLAPYKNTLEDIARGNV